MMAKYLMAVTAAIASLCCSTAVQAQELTTGTCQEVVGDVAIGGVMQQVSGLACLQPDGTWQLVDGAGGGVVYAAPAYYYDYDPWYWTPLAVGFGASVVFVDRFHRFHHMNRVFVRNSGVVVRGGGFHDGFHRRFHNGFHGGFHDGFHGGPHGGFHGGPHGGSGGFHGGGGMHR